MDPKLDLHIVHQFLKRLTTPFEEWEAYHYGIIDKNGNILKNREEIPEEQQAAWTAFDVLVTNLKKELAKLAGGKQKMSSMMMALYYVREKTGKKIATSEPQLAKTKGQVFKWAKMKDVKEDAVAVNALGGGKIAGAGIGPDGEPPVRKRARMLSRIMSNARNRRKQTY